MAVVILLPQDGLLLALPQRLTGSGHPVERAVAREKGNSITNVKN
jgi:hypothetical protein